MARKTRDNIRNVAIIAHVDHGKTTLVDAMLHQAGVFRENQQVAERVMDKLDLEREKGITILSKNTTIRWQDNIINILDTPGHADFGGQVQRVLRMVDGCLLLVDASEGPLPQTRYVLSNALELGLSPIVVINKIDRPDARIGQVLDEVLELFLDLDATEEQCHFPVVYTNAKLGTATHDLSVEGENLMPLFRLLFDKVPAPVYDDEAPLQLQITTLDYSDYVGRIGIGRIANGTINQAEQVMLIKNDGSRAQAKVTQLYTYEGLARVDAKSAWAGEIVALAGVENMDIGDTVTSVLDPRPLPPLKIDEPTLEMVFSVNTSPFAGREGKYVTTRQIRDRLFKEIQGNPALRVEDAENMDGYRVYGRGELQMAILIETMRREGYEMNVGRPRVLFKTVNGKRMEPYESVLIDCPEEFVGVITSTLGMRRGRMTHMTDHATGWVRTTFEIPMRGLIGIRPIMLTMTRGTAIMNSQFLDYRPVEGEVTQRANGVLIADREGRVTAYALNSLQDRGEVFVAPGTQVYEGMVCGENSRDNDLVVNIVREKKLTNMRASGSDENYKIAPPRPMSLEEAIAFINDDELVEVTPESIRLRKMHLSEEARKQAAKRAAAATA
ncbi:MAG: translational GTPase TypA [Calditrichaeota bacterium]|nr:translational GTPase TypA [Calditrichota bacterium]MCB9365606.1 translational GTPase TypA [Calditrichota bacterium]